MERVGRRETAVATDDDEVIDAVLDEIVCRLEPALAGPELVGSGGADDRAALVHDAADRVPGHRLEDTSRPRPARGSPLLMATGSTPASSAVRTAARMAAFMPGASPPLVRMPSLCFRVVFFVHRSPRPGRTQAGILTLDLVAVGLSQARAVKAARAAAIRMITANRRLRAAGESRVSARWAPARPPMSTATASGPAIWRSTDPRSPWAASPATERVKTVAELIAATSRGAAHPRRSTSGPRKTPPPMPRKPEARPIRRPGRDRHRHRRVVAGGTGSSGRARRAQHGSGGCGQTDREHRQEELSRCRDEPAGKGGRNRQEQEGQQQPRLQPPGKTEPQQRGTGDHHVE